MNKYDPTNPDKGAHRTILSSEDEGFDEFIIVWIAFILGVIVGTIIC